MELSKAVASYPCLPKVHSPEFLSLITRANKNWINLLKAALQNRYHTQDRLYNMRVKLHELRQGSSLETYTNDLDTLTHHLEIHYFIFGLNPKLKQALLIRHPKHTTMLLPLQSGSTTLQIPILILSWWTSCKRSVI